MRSLVICLALLASSADAFVAPTAHRLSVHKASSVAFQGQALVRKAPLGLRMMSNEEAPVEPKQPNPWLSLNTRGGAMLWTGVLLVLPFFAYAPLSAVMGDELAAGRALGAFYCLFGLIAWTSSYVFRVGTKDMTYTKQLKAYEDAVIAKRFEELQADEVEALLSDMESDKKDDGPEPPVIKGSGWRPDQY